MSETALKISIPDFCIINRDTKTIRDCFLNKWNSDKNGVNNNAKYI